MKAGSRPADAYGENDPRGIQQVPKSAFKGVPDVKVGMQFQSQGQGGHTQTVRVVKIDNETVTGDANHPLAGVTLHFDVDVKDVRVATPEEVVHGHVHGAGGHHH